MLSDTYEWLSDDFWKRVPGWSTVTRDQFGDHRWQQEESITSVDGLARILGGRLSPELLSDFRAGFERTPMRIRITPYLMALIDWSDPTNDPIRRQFIPLHSQFLDDHPASLDDSLNEDGDRVTPFLVRRYPDKVLFLPLTICPVYCSFCTRSRLVGGSTPHKTKSSYGASPRAWDATFDYLRLHQEIEDVVISGGDAYMLKPDAIEHIGRTLLAIPHIRRLRYATKGLAALPMKITSDDAWVSALRRVSEAGRHEMKEVSVQTHFNAPSEMTEWTEAAMRRLTELGLTVRNQSVLIRGVNDAFESMHRLIKRLSYLQIQPYLVYLHDLVPGCEHLRTTLSTAQNLFKDLLGTTAGFNTPRFVCDTPGGGGKREISSCEGYDRELGVSAWTAPRVRPGHVFYYYDPIDQLPASGIQIWRDPVERAQRLRDFTSRMQQQTGSAADAGACAP